MFIYVLINVVDYSLLNEVVSEDAEGPSDQLGGGSGHWLLLSIVTGGGCHVKDLNMNPVSVTSAHQARRRLLTTGSFYFESGRGAALFLTSCRHRGTFWVL